MATPPRFSDLHLDTGFIDEYPTNTPSQNHNVYSIAGTGVRESPSGDGDASKSETINKKSGGALTSTVAEPPSTLDQEAIAADSQQNGASGNPTTSVYQALQNRRTSINFDPQITLDSGHRQSMQEPLQKPVKARPRGRSLLQAISDEKSRTTRAHSESDQTHYDQTTGQPLPKYAAELDENKQPHIGELRHPLLQTTIDELARESQTDLSSQSTISPSIEEFGTPRDEQDFILSPSGSSPFQHPASFEDTTQWQRRKRAADRSQTVDFTKRTGSMQTAMRQSPRVGSRRSTSSSTKSPQSAASSWLRGFSIGSAPDSAMDPPAPDSQGQMIGDSHVLGRQIGYGGFSTIHEATQMLDSGEQRKIAAKVVPKIVKEKSAEDNEQVQAEFNHEVELWRLLHHRHILPLESVYHTDDATYCFIPLNVGGTLFDLVKSNRAGVPIDLAKRYSYQLAVALRYLHRDARVAHRDVKLENCLLDKSIEPNEVRLCDFGMAEWMSGNDFSDDSADRPPQKNIGPSDTSSVAFAGGSLEYAAPETLLNAKYNKTERAPVSPAVDMWAYGVCVYTMVVGSRPFYDPFAPRITTAILAGAWDREKLQAKGGKDAYEVVENCLNKYQEKRWTADDVLSCKWLQDFVEANEDQDDGYGSEWKL